jgi:hypothetical protein
MMCNKNFCKYIIITNSNEAKIIIIVENYHEKILEHEYC